MGGTLSCAWSSPTTFHKESALRRTLRSVRLIAFIEMCIGKQTASTPLALFLPLRNAEGSEKWHCAGAKIRASSENSQQRGIDHEITNFHPVVSHFAGTPPMDRVPVDSLCALAHALDGSPHEA